MDAETVTAPDKAAVRAEALKAWHAIEAKTADELKAARAALVKQFPVLREIFTEANHS